LVSQETVFAGEKVKKFLPYQQIKDTLGMSFCKLDTGNTKDFYYGS